MKLLSGIAVIWACGLAFAAAQLTVPPNPNQFTKRDLGESGSGSTGMATAGAHVSTPKTIVVNYVSVSPLRQWTNGEGKTMMARLLAFSAPEKGETGPVEVIRDGAVRFLLSGKNEPIDYPLANLSEEDQAQIRSIAKAAAGGPPKPVSSTKTAEEPDAEED